MMLGENWEHQNEGRATEIINIFVNKQSILLIVKIYLIVKSKHYNII